LLCARTEREGPSVGVQKRYSLAISARELREIKYHVFESVRCIPGEHSEVAVLSTCTEIFQCVIFPRGKGNINKSRQIFKSLCEHLKLRTAKIRSYGRAFHFENTLFIQVQIFSVTLAKQCVKVALMVVYVSLRSKLRF